MHISVGDYPWESKSHEEAAAIIQKPTLGCVCLAKSICVEMHSVLDESADRCIQRKITERNQYKSKDGESAKNTPSGWGEEEERERAREIIRSHVAASETIATMY